MLPFAASKAAEGFLSEPGAKLFDWLASKVKGTPAAATLDRAVSEPQNQRRLDALRLEIEELAEKDPEFRNQLFTLLKEIAPQGITGPQTSTQIGDNNKNAQATGKDIKINIS